MTHQQTKRTVDTLARSVGKHFTHCGLPPAALVDLACQLLDEAQRQLIARRATAE